MKTIYSILICACAANGLYAQKHDKDTTLNRTIVVENTYNPEVMDAFKVNVLPKIEEPTAAKKEIDYATAARPLTTWTFVPMNAITPDSKQPNQPKGYFRAAYGTRNNTDVKASYLWDMSSTDQLSLMGSLYGYDGKMPEVNDNGLKWSSHFFRSSASIDYKHQFKSMALKLGGEFGSQVFNYMPSGNQHFTEGGGYVGVQSTGNDYPVKFKATAGFRMFDIKHPVQNVLSDKEKDFWFDGCMSANLEDNQQIGVGITLDQMSYDNYHPNYMHMRGNPFYQLETDNIKLRLGAIVTWQNHAESGFTVSPDVMFEAAFAETYKFYAQATGGTELNGFKRLNELSPYWCAIEESPINTTHTMVDAQAGIKGTPIPGLTFSVFGGYKAVEDDLFLTPFGKGASSEDGLWTSTVNDVITYQSIVSQANSHKFYGGASLDYSMKDRISFSLNGVYNGWSDTDNGYMMYLKPQASLNASVRAKVYSDIYAQVLYHYESRVGKINGKKADAINNLSLMAGYEFFNRLNLFVRLDNVLNQHYLTETAYPVQRFSTMAGLSIRF